VLGVKGFKFLILGFGGVRVQGLGCRVQGRRGSRMVAPDIDAHSGIDVLRKSLSVPICDTHP